MEQQLHSLQRHQVQAHTVAAVHTATSALLISTNICRAFEKLDKRGIYCEFT
jgi:CMP-N-acetylneuraminic acid synthetase